MTTIEYTLPVYKTDKLTAFKKLNGNRDLKKSQVRRIEKILDKDPEFTKLNPIKVNEALEIIDGQHRVQALINKSIELAKPLHVYYIVTKGASLKEAKALNAGSKPWTPKDYAIAFAKEGNKHYKIYLQFIDLYGLNHDITARALSKTRYGMDDFRDGTFQIGDKDLSHRLCEQLRDFNKYVEQWNHRSFAISFFQIAEHPQYIHSRMMSQVAKFSDTFIAIPLRNKEMSQHLNMVYNLSRKDRIDLLN